MLEDLVVTKKLTSAPRADQKANLTAVAAQRLYGRGVRLRPGQTFDYMITGAEARLPNDHIRASAFCKVWHYYARKKCRDIFHEASEPCNLPSVSSRALEKMGVFALRKEIPSLDRMLDSDQELDLKSFAGGNLGLPNYRDDAERRLVRNAAEAEETYQTVSKLAKTNPAQAREYMRDPDNAAYALFHRDFAQVVAALKRIDQTREHIEASGLTAAEKKIRLAALDKSRQTLLGHADALHNLLFERLQKAPQPRLAPGFLNQPRPRIPLAVQ